MYFTQTLSLGLPFSLLTPWSTPARSQGCSIRYRIAQIISVVSRDKGKEEPGEASAASPQDDEGGPISKLKAIRAAAEEYSAAEQRVIERNAFAELCPDLVAQWEEQGLDW